MKSFMLVLLMAFVIGLFENCCEAFAHEEVATAIDGSRDCENSSEEHHSQAAACHCPTSYHYKIFAGHGSNASAFLKIERQNFPDHLDGYEYLNSYLIFHPPIS